MMFDRYCRAGPWSRRPVGKSYASIVDDEKTAFLAADKYKNPATVIIAAFADMGGSGD